MIKLSKIGNSTILGITILFSILLSSLVYSYDTSSSISTHGEILYHKWSIRSVCIFPFDDYYSQSTTDTKLNEIRTRLPEVNYIEIRTFWEPDPNDSNNMIYTGGDVGYLGTPTNSWVELEAAAAKIRSRNMGVMLWATKEWSAPRPNPSNWTIWMQNYAKYAKMVAQWAETNQISIFIFGAEYDNFISDYSLLGSDYSGQWNQTISNVRSVFLGKVGFGFNWWYSPLHWNVVYNQSSWITHLDYIQIDSFVSLGITRNDYINGTRANATQIANSWSPSIQSLVGNWTDNRMGPNWNYTQMFEQLATKYNKKIIINIGARNNNGTSTMPWMNVPLRDMYGNEIPGSGPDVGEMNDYWIAFFLTWRNSRAIAGVDMEHYSQGNTNSIDGSFRNKYDTTSGLYTWQIISIYLQSLEL